MYIDCSIDRGVDRAWHRPVGLCCGASHRGGVGGCFERMGALTGF